MAGNSSSGSNDTFVECSVFDTADYVTVAIVSSGSALLSCLFCIIVIGLIFLLKKHYFFIQRLVLYLSIVALINSLSIVLRLHRIGYQQQTEALKVLCMASAFINQTSTWSLLMAFTAITFTLLMAVVFQKSTTRLEWVYVIMIFIFPLTYNWIPFLYNTYGQAGAWCWIRNVNYYDCTEYEFGTILQYALWYGTGYGLMAMLLLVYTFIIVCVLRQKLKRRDAAAKEVQDNLHREVLPLLFYPICVLILNIFPIINRIYGTVTMGDPVYALWILHAALSPLQGGYIALIYVLDRRTLERLTCKTFVTFFKRDDGVHEYPAERGELSDSASQSFKSTRNTIHADKEKGAGFSNNVQTRLS